MVLTVFFSLLKHVPMSYSIPPCSAFATAVSQQPPASVRHWLNIHVIDRFLTSTGHNRQDQGRYALHGHGIE